MIKIYSFTPGVQPCTLLLLSTLIFLLTLFWFYPTVAQAEIYRSVDKHGNAYYSDKPHPSAELYQSDTHIQPIPKPQLPKIQIPKAENQKKKSTKAADAKKLAKLKKRCENLEKKIKKVNYKLRQAHSNKQGNQLRKQRREYSDQRSKECRR